MFSFYYETNIGHIVEIIPFTHPLQKLDWEIEKFDWIPNKKKDSTLKLSPMFCENQVRSM